MRMNADDELRSAAVINLLVKEYDSLRGQLVTNLVQTAGLTTLGITAVALLFGFAGTIRTVVAGSILISVILGFSYYVFMRMNVLLPSHFRRRQALTPGAGLPHASAPIASICLKVTQSGNRIQACGRWR
jgi:hypothetical protein